MEIFLLGELFANYHTGFFFSENGNSDDALCLFPSATFIFLDNIQAVIRVL